MMSFNRLRSLLTELDAVSIFFLTFLTLLAIAFHSVVQQWLIITAVNAAVIIGIIVLAHEVRHRPTLLLRTLYRWYSYPIVLFVYKEIYWMVQPIHPFDYDHVFIAIDHAIFGVNPTQWLYQFANPVLTEILQWAYSSYYVLFVLIGVELYRRGRPQDFDRGAFLIVYGFYLSYVGYFLMPAVGPRFTLHDFNQLSQELPGLFLTEYMRAFVNIGESIPMNFENARALVQRDVFPSGHTQLTLIVVYLAFHYRVHTRKIIAIITSMLIFSTIYLRYHYVTDLIGGLFFFLFTIWSGNKLADRWNRIDAVR